MHHIPQSILATFAATAESESLDAVFDDLYARKAFCSPSAFRCYTRTRSKNRKLSQGKSAPVQGFTVR